MGLTEFSKPRILHDDDSIEGFRSAADTVNDWLLHHARKAAAGGNAVVYVSVEQSTGQLAGYYTLSSGAIVRQQVDGGWLQRNAPRHIPVILLGQLGVDERFAHRGLGLDLLTDAVRRAHDAARSIGVRALVVDSLPGAVDFYVHHGFRHVPGLLGVLYAKIAER